MPVATAPPMEMCGSDGRFASAQPRSSSAWPTSPIRADALTVAVRAASSISTSTGSRSSATSTPSPSAQSLKECRVPRACTRREEATSSQASSTDPGCSIGAEKVRLRAQLRSVATGAT